ncbi:MAG: CBS domain-containing protein [Deltaproteobacteria bacterium]|nr:CBS domain-containing protein [Deltaproteobacteria bacterium]
MQSLMPMLMPTITRCMTSQPWTIRPDATMADAHTLMREHRIRHLPVVDDGRLVGVVSERDLHLMETLPDATPETISVREAMTEQVYSVSPAEDLADVVEQMADHKFGSVIVVEHQRVVGIFTAGDALQVLAEVLRRVTS